MMVLIHHSAPCPIHLSVKQPTDLGRGILMAKLDIQSASEWVSIQDKIGNSSFIVIILCMPFQHPPHCKENHFQSQNAPHPLHQRSPLYSDGHLAKSVISPIPFQCSRKYLHQCGSDRVDTFSWRWWCMQEKLWLNVMVRQWWYKKACTKRDLSSLIGHLSHACMQNLQARETISMMLNWVINKSEGDRSCSSSFIMNRELFPESRGLGLGVALLLFQVVLAPQGEELLCHTQSFAHPLP